MHASENFFVSLMRRLNAKAWFAVERTFLHWATISVIIALGPKFYFIFPSCAVFLVVLAYSTYSYRINLLKQDEAPSKSLLNPLYPAIILTVILSLLILSPFVLKT